MSAYGYGLHNLPIVEYVSVLTIKIFPYIEIPCSHIHKTIHAAAKCGRKRMRQRNWNEKDNCDLSIARRDEKPLTVEENETVSNSLSFGRTW